MCVLIFFIFVTVFCKVLELDEGLVMVRVVCFYHSTFLMCWYVCVYMINYSVIFCCCCGYQLFCSQVFAYINFIVLWFLQCKI